MDSRDRSGAGREAADRANLDPITKEPGAHPVGTGAGALAGGVAGAAAGSLAGPVGAAAGAVVGAVGGGLAGKAGAEAINPTQEDAYWRENYKDRPYVNPGASYEQYRPAYQFGWESYQKHGRRFGSFDEADRELAREWAGRRAGDWETCRAPARDAWERLGSNRRP
jgi:hypothetical protein